MEQGELSHPPRARLAFRVGVVGHRPNRLPKDAEELGVLQGRIEAVLDAVAETVGDFQAKEPGGGLYAAGPPLLRAVSPLAEGSDRMLAEAALKRGYALDCPMPFAQADFEKDFEPGLEPDSVARFRGLLEEARGAGGLAVFELDGRRSDEPAAYGAAGRVVLNQSDLLVVIWDGDKPAGGGGTVETLHEAIRYHVPVLWLDPYPPFGWTVLRKAEDLECLKGEGRCRPASEMSARPQDDLPAIRAAVAEIVRHEIDLPPQAEARDNAAAFFGEARPGLNVAFAWKVFRDLVGSSRLRMPALRTEDFVAAIAPSWPTSLKDERAGAPTALPGAPLPIRYWANARLREHYAWSDKPADLCADNHRSGYILSYLLAALAVLVALLPMAMEWHGIGDTVCIAVEFVILVWILVLFGWARLRRYHERWMEYRLLAELIRQLRLLAPLGGGRPLPRTPTHLAGHGDPAHSWMSWHLRAIARSVGLPNAQVTPSYLADCLDDLFTIADGPREGQRAFHDLNHARSEAIHHRLHQVSFGLFFLTMAGIAAHFIVHVGGGYDEELKHIAERWGQWMVVGSAFLPALGAAFAGINNTGEFSRLAKRSHAMAEGFEEFARRIEALRGRLAEGGGVRLAEVVPVAGSMAQTMVDEVVDWRVVVLDRPQSV